MNIFGDKLIIIHAENCEIMSRKGNKTQIYIDNIKLLVEFYLRSNKQVFFTRIGNNTNKVDYLNDYYSRIIWVPKNGILSIDYQIKFIRDRLSLNRNHNLEFAGGFEKACFGHTVSGVLGTTASGLNSELVHKNGKEVILYKPNDKLNPLKGFAKRENIF